MKDINEVKLLAQFFVWIKIGVLVFLTQSLFVILKLTGVMAWSWVWVFLPVYVGPFLLIIGLIAVSRMTRGTG